MRVSAIVLAAGIGKRFHSVISKPLIKVNSKPVIIYSLETLNKHPAIKEIIVVVSSENLEGIIDVIWRYKINKAKKIVLGGKRRQDSVTSGLKAINKDAKFVLIHDAARPFIDKKIVSAVLREAQISKAAIVGVPVKATIKEVHGSRFIVHSNVIVNKTLNREDLWEIQTPQVFAKELILKAYNKFGNIKATDDAMLVEKLGKKVRIVLGSYFNIKITTPEDLILAKAIVLSFKSKVIS